MKLLILIYSKTFFVWCTDYDSITEYTKTMNENIFACMELMKQPYMDIMHMPIGRFQQLLKWKSKLEEEKEKQMQDLSKN